MMARHRLFLFAAVIFCSWSSYVCNPTVVPWALSEDDNICILLTFEGKITVNYPKKDNSNGILVIDLKDATVAVAEGNKCTNDEPQIALKWNGTLMELTYFQNKTNQKYGVKSIEFTLPQDLFTDISPPLNGPIKVSYDKERWLTAKENSFKCDHQQEIQLMSTIKNLTATFTYSKFQHQAFMSDKVFNTAKQQICSFGYANPWAWDDGTKSCILATFDGLLEVTYNDTEGKTVSRNFTIPKNQKAINGKCDDKEQSLTVVLEEAGSGMTLTYTKNETNNTYKLQKVEITLPETSKNISPSLSKPVLLSYSGDGWSATVGKAYECDTPSVLKMKAEDNRGGGVLTISKAKHEAFRANKDHTTFSEPEICLPPKVGYANPWAWYDGTKSCILATFDGLLKVTYNDTEGKTVSRNFAIPKDKIAINGKCDAVEQSLTVALEEAGSEMTLTYTKDEPNKKYKLQKVEIKLPETSLKNISSPLSTPVLLSYSGDVWSATKSKAYECDTPIELKMTEKENRVTGGVLTISKAKHEAFRTNKDHTTFSESDKCAEPATPWSYTNQESKVVCVIAEFDAQFNLLVNNVTKYVSVPLNAEVKEGSCDDACQWFKLEWMTNGSANSLKMSFKKKNTQYYLSELDVTLAPNNFVGTSHEKEVHLNYTGAEWNTDVEKSYLCNNTTDLSLKSDTNGIEGKMTLSKNHVEAYRTSKEANFSQNKGECGVEESSSNAAVIAVTVIVSLAVVGAGVYFGMRYWKK